MFIEGKDSFDSKMIYQSKVVAVCIAQSSIIELFVNLMAKQAINSISDRAK